MGEEMIPIVAIVMTFLVPLVLALTYHQRKMAEILHRNQVPTPLPEQMRLEREIEHLKQLMHQQTIALDSLQGKIDSALAKQSEDEVRQRLRDN